MARTYLYPITIIPKFMSRNSQYDIQSLSTNPDAKWENVCNDEPSVICWGDVNPDAVDRNNPVNSANFYNTITTYSGSFDTPTPFTTSGWKNSIPNNAKITKIDVEYDWDQVKYTGSNNCVTWQGSGCKGHYVSAGGYFKSGPQVTLSIAGKTLSVTGPGVRSSDACTRKNAYTYNNGELKSCGVNIPGVSGFRGSDLSNAKITFTPSKNYASDVCRIVMRFIRLYVEYEDVPPTFNLEDVSLSVSSLTNCPNETSTMTIKVNNNSETQGQTQLRIKGAGIANADDSVIASSKILAGNDELVKDGNDYLWRIKNDCYQRKLSFKLAYDGNVQAGEYPINVRIGPYQGKVTEKNVKISVKSCKPDFSFDVLDKNGNVTNQHEYIDIENSTVYLRVKLHKNQILNHNENIRVDTNGLMSLESWSETSWNMTPSNIQCEEKDGICTFTGFKDAQDIILQKEIRLDTSGTYNVIAQYNNTTESSWSKDGEYKFTVKGSFLGTEYFKLRLEDGSDVRYNSLMVTKGDDLLEPLTYKAEEIDKYVSQMNVYGEAKRIPINEVQYVHFTIDLDTEEEVELKNVLTYIEIYDEKEYSNGILVGTGKGVNLLETKNEYICSIDTISSKKSNIIKLAVKSSTEIDDVIIKIKPYNYDGYNEEDKWIPSHIMFKDIPDIKLSIEGITDITYDEANANDSNSYFDLVYTIQNLSNIPAKNVRFQLDEPTNFKKESYVFNKEQNSQAWFNENNRIITFPLLKDNSIEQTLKVRYKATKKGIYDFIIRTLDDANTLDDDQYQNSCTHNVMVNIPNDVAITTNVSNNLPHIGELLDFNIKVKNLYKKQNNFKFDIYDIGSYDNSHQINDYKIEYVKCKNGTFTPMHGESYKYPNSHTQNKVGEWCLEDIDIDDEYHLTITVRPQDTGNHIFKTVFTDQFNNTKDFYNEVRVLEQNKQLNFDVYHAVGSDENTKCDNCDDLIKICDDDFINLGDNIFYVFEIKNNSRNPISNAIHVYARLPNSFLTNKVLCSSRNYLLNQTNDLISFTIPRLEGCQHDDSKIKFCIKLQPSETGKFVSNFSLSTRNSHVLYKQLYLTVDTEFNNRKTEHEINIYNFEKTNKYYRYEIDNVGNIFKFYNTGDRTLRPVDSEEYNKSAIETYRGTNLKSIINKIKEKSKYVDPLFLQVGNNKLADKGYELFPDGLMRRFGLLNSEVYHYTGQLPITTDLVDRAMKWDIDKWDTKVWAGDIYDNGVFGLTVDYAKIPSNFSILDVDNPIKNLQNLVDNVKPYGTKAICHYSATIHANLQINIEDIITKVKYDIDVHLKLPEDFTVISAYNRYDSTSTIYHDLAKFKLNIEVDSLISKITSTERNDDTISSSIDAIYNYIFADKISKSFTNECYDLISYAYNTSIQKKNIDITKPYDMTYNTETSNSLSDIQILNIDFKNNIDDKEEVGLLIIPQKDTVIYDNNNTKNNYIKCVFYKDDINDFIGFNFIFNDKIIQQRCFNKDDINYASVQVQTCMEGDKNILHFWGSINKEEYYHIGLLILDDFKEPVCRVIKKQGRSTQQYNVVSNNDTPITFKISDKIHTINKQHDTIYAIENKNKWQYLNNICKKNNEYTFFENNIDIDKECESRKINVPKLALKYKNINIDDLDEIVDIKFKIEAQTNKENFADDININLFKNGDKYIPENGIAREIVYPSSISNINQDFITTFDIEQRNMTICSNCLKTSLGYHDECIYCGSSYVRHSDSKTPATACYNCGWIINGWNDYCTHCRSYDIEKIQIDYNKTYCNDCGVLSLDYYQYCPQCFSSNVMHLTQNTTRYKIFGEDKDNIEPISIYIDTDEDYIDVFSLYAPLNKETTELSDLQYLTLKVHGTNHNDGKYYHCTACNSADLGNYEQCPYCNSKLINNYSVSAYTLRPFYHAGRIDIMYEDMLSSCPLDNYETDATYDINIPNGAFTKEIDLMKCAYHNGMDKFKLTFRIENQQRESIQQAISKLPIKDEYKIDILNELLLYNITIDNLSIDYKYVDEHEWYNLDNLEGANHTGIVYDVTNDKDNTDKINFGFDTKGKYKHAYLYIAGLFKDINYITDMNIEIINNNKLYKKQVSLKNSLFSYEYDIVKDIGETINDLSVKISFSNTDKGAKIIITDCNITFESTKYKKELHDDINKISSEFVSEHNDYLFKSLNNNLWGLNNTQPYYLSGKQLKTNLIGYIDFGKLDLQEYIRIYNIDMIVSYKAKNGNIITRPILPAEEDNTLKQILLSAGYNQNQIDNIINNNISLQTALEGKIISADEEKQQLISGDVYSQDSMLWGTINNDLPILNNLESDKLNNLGLDITDLNEDDELVNSIPLYYKIAQAFNTGDNIDSIGTIFLDYAGKRGYPNNLINVHLCKDYDGRPGDIIATNKVKTDNIETTLNVNLNVYNLNLNTQYWIVIEDISANHNNYHRFNYNNSTNSFIGELRTYEGGHYTHQNCVLSFGVNKIIPRKTFYNLPTRWSLEPDDIDGYKIHYRLYRYNIQDGSNVSLSNFLIKSGYKIWSNYND